MNEQAETLNNPSTFQSSDLADEVITPPEGAPEDKSEEAKEDSQKPKREGWELRRIGKLTEQKYQLKAERDHWKQMAESKAAQEKSQVSPDVEPELEHFADPKDFHKAMAKWAIAQERKASTETNPTRSEKAIPEKSEEAFTEREAAFREAHEDYDEVIEELQETITLKGRGLAPDVLQFIAEADKGADILYALGQDLKEAKRIAALSPARQLIEIGKLEDKVSAGIPKRKAVTSAPPPIRPVGGKASATEDPDNMTMEEFARYWKRNQ